MAGRALKATGHSERSERTTGRRSGRPHSEEVSELSRLDVLALAAHPDDVELCAGGGRCACSTAQDYETGVVDFTRGEVGTRGTPERRQCRSPAGRRGPRPRRSPTTSASPTGTSRTRLRKAPDNSSGSSTATAPTSSYQRAHVPAPGPRGRRPLRHRRPVLRRAREAGDGRGRRDARRRRGARTTSSTTCSPSRSSPRSSWT